MMGNLLESNQLLSGGLILMILGGLLVWLKSVPGKIYNFFERFFIIKIEILDEDESYQWMQVWLAERLKDTLSISVITKRNNNNNDYDEDFKVQSKPKVYFVPACGTYFFWYKKRFVTLHRTRQESSSTPLIGGDKNLLRPKESFVLKIFSRNKDLAKQLIEECRDFAIPEDGKIDIRVSSYNYWSTGCRILPRKLESVILDGTIAQDLLEDIKSFKNSYDWYLSVGVPWRKSFLLEGKPGNGKTSLVKAIAGELNMNIYFLMLNDPDMTDNRFSELLSKIGENNILLLEDIDCAFNKREASGKGLTFSGLLNGIDGVSSTEGRIIFMTTNHKEKLDPALIRPGRADVHITIDNASCDQGKRLFERFYPEQKELSVEFGKLLPNKMYNMATLQNYLMAYRNNPIAAIKNMAEIGKMYSTPLIEPHESHVELELLSETDALED